MSNSTPLDNFKRLLLYANVSEELTSYFINFNIFMLFCYNCQTAQYAVPKTSIWHPIFTNVGIGSAIFFFLLIYNFILKTSFNGSPLYYLAGQLAVISLVAIAFGYFWLFMKIYYRFYYLTQGEFSLDKKYKHSEYLD